MQLRDVMTRNLKTIDSNESLHQAAMLMRDLDVGILPVSEQDKVVGTITDRDITIRATASGASPDDTKVAQIFSQGVVFAQESDDAGAAAKTMEDRQVRRLLVLDADDKCVGIVSMGDLALRTGDQELGGEVLHETSKPEG